MLRVIYLETGCKTLWHQLQMGAVVLGISRPKSMRDLKSHIPLGRFEAGERARKKNGKILQLRGMDPLGSGVWGAPLTCDICERSVGFSVSETSVDRLFHV